MTLAHYAVMGSPVAHSLSPVIHHQFAKQTGLALVYEKILIDLPRFEQQVRDFFHEGGKGLNITLPCKERAFNLSDEPTARCLKAKAANTLWMKDGRLHVDNTDGIGLLRDLGRYIDVAGKAILILGAGGAARGILGPLLEAGPSRLTIVNRTIEKARNLQLDFSGANVCSLDELALHADQDAYDVVINATSANLHGEAISLPVSLMALKPFCYDLSYKKNQATPFVLSAEEAGCKAVDGLGMLVEQAGEAFFIWHGVMPDTGAVLKLLKD